MGTRVLYWPRREADHSPPSSAEVKNQWHYTPVTLHVFVVLSRKTLFPYNVHIQFSGVLQGLHDIRGGKGIL